MAKPIRNQFTIRDLENMSGIKAHTIRMWEQRYQLFTPVRAGNNVRYYSQNDLRKWLNVASLYHQGYKISAITQMRDNVLRDTVRQERLNEVPSSIVQHSFILSMLTYDAALFHQTYSHLIENLPFRDVFRQYLVPLLEQIGFLWQTESITIAHEHFISHLIQQKIMGEIEKTRIQAKKTTQKAFVLFLPENEIHELALLFTYYELIHLRRHTVYLGQSVPLKALRDLRASFQSITYVSFFTVEPTRDQVIPYLREASQLILRKGKDVLQVSGQKILELKRRPSIPGVHYVLPGDPWIWEKS